LCLRVAEGVVNIGLPSRPLLLNNVPHGPSYVCVSISIRMRVCVCVCVCVCGLDTSQSAAVIMHCASDPQLSKLGECLANPQRVYDHPVCLCVCMCVCVC